MIHLLDVETLQQWLNRREVFLIDVRQEDEYNESHIDGSVLMPLDKLSLEDVILKNKDKRKIAIHCRLGGRSMKACKALLATDPDLEVYNVEGGIVAWHAMNGAQDDNPNSGGAKCSI